MIIDYQKHMFEITCNYADSMIVRNLPQRKFSKKPYPHWEAKALKGNARYIRNILEKRSTVTPAARAKIDELLAEDITALPVTYPADYRFKLEPYSKQLETIRFLFGKPAWALFAEMGCGKAAGLNTLVYTPKGPVKMGAIRIGDLICTPDGKRAEVTGVFPQGLRPVYEITFTDGTAVTCDENHLWNVQTPGMKNRKKGFMNKSTKELLDSSLYQKGTNNLKWFIPITEPVDFEEKPLPIDPYLLGALLGDGSLNGCGLSITKNNPCFIDKIRERLPENHSLSKYTHNTFGIVGERKNNIVRSTIRAYRLNVKSKDKFIPDEYLYNSMDNRVSLLQGLMDSDGYALKISGAEYYTSSKNLALNVQTLIQSLGGTAKLSVKKEPKYSHNGEIRVGLNAYRLRINLPKNISPFLTAPKKDYYTPQTKYVPRRGILSIKYIGKEPTQCIMINHPDHLYLMDNFTVTHNTKITLDLWSMYAKAALVQGLIVVSRVSIRQNWIDEVEKHCPDDLDFDTFIIDSTSTKLMREAYAPKTKPFIISVGVESLSVQQEGGKAFDAVYDIARRYKCMLVIDEAHSVKNPRSVRTQNADLIAKHCAIRGIMTGTPTPKDFLDLYSQFAILDQDIIGHYNYFTFRNHYAVMGGYEGKQIVAYRNEQELMDKIKPYTMRFKKSDIVDLPPKVYERRIVSMPKELEKMYLEMKNDRGIVLEGESIEARTVLASYAKLRQMANGFVYGEDQRYDLADNHPKIGELLDIIDGTDEKLIIWCNTHGEIDTLLPKLQKYGVSPHHGKMSIAEREQSKKDFRDKNRIFLATIPSAMVGLTLTEATIEVFYSNPLSYTDRIQAEDRAHRIGQENKVTIIDLICKNTVEEVIWTALMMKKSILEYVLGSVENKNLTNTTEVVIMDQHMEDGEK